MPSRRSPIQTSRVAVEDIVLIADGTGVHLAVVRRRDGDRLVVSPVTRLAERRPARLGDVTDHWHHAERSKLVSAEQLQLGLPDA